MTARDKIHVMMLFDFISTLKTMTDTAEPMPFSRAAEDQDGQRDYLYYDDTSPRKVRGNTTGYPVLHFGFYPDGDSENRPASESYLENYEEFTGLHIDIVFSTHENRTIWKIIVSDSDYQNDMPVEAIEVCYGTVTTT